MRTIYVVNWTPDDGVGGFEWRVSRAEAEAVAADLRTDTAGVRVHETTVPAHLRTWQVSELLDEQGWSDGGDPREEAWREGPDAQGPCILTGSPGEEEDDCTTHDHEIA